MTDNTTILKKIYIKDYLINTKLLNKSINNLLLNHLSNKFYKTKDINHKIDNIVNKINFIYKEDYNKNKIFNLAYQPYNQYNTTYNYFNNNYNKKWILPIVNHQKNLYINSFDIDQKTNRINNIHNIKTNNFIVNNNSNIQLIDLKMVRGYSLLSDVINLFYLLYLIKRGKYHLTLSFTPKAGFLNCIASYLCRTKYRN